MYTLFIRKGKCYATMGTYIEKCSGYSKNMEFSKAICGSCKNRKMPHITGDNSTPELLLNYFQSLSSISGHVVARLVEALH
jgi:hypothetical protein